MGKLEQEANRLEARIRKEGEPTSEAHFRTIKSLWAEHDVASARVAASRKARFDLVRGWSTWVYLLFILLVVIARFAT